MKLTDCDVQWRAEKGLRCFKPCSKCGLGTHLEYPTWECNLCGTANPQSYNAEAAAEYDAWALFVAEENERLKARAPRDRSENPHNHIEMFMLPTDAPPDDRIATSIADMEQKMEKYGIDKDVGIRTHDGHPPRRLTPAEAERIAGSRYRGS